MNLIAVVTSMYIYHGCSTQKTLLEGKFTVCEVIPTNIKSCGRRNVRKHREFKNGEKYITLDISLKFGSMEKMNITSSEQQDYFRKSEKVLITFLGLNTIGRSNLKKGKVCH